MSETASHMEPNEHDRHLAALIKAAESQKPQAIAALRDYVNAAGALDHQARLTQLATIALQDLIYNQNPETGAAFVRQANALAASFHPESPLEQIIVDQIIQSAQYLQLIDMQCQEAFFQNKDRREIIRFQECAQKRHFAAIKLLATIRRHLRPKGAQLPAVAEKAAEVTLNETFDSEDILRPSQETTTSPTLPPSEWPIELGLPAVDEPKSTPLGRIRPRRGRRPTMGVLNGRA